MEANNSGFFLHTNILICEISWLIPSICSPDKEQLLFKTPPFIDFLLQTPIFDPPYTKTDHNICSYAGYKEVEFILTECEDGYEQEIYYTINATACECRPVNSQNYHYTNEK